MSASTIDEYLQALDDNGKKYVNNFIGFMKQEYPNITPKMCFSMPMWLAGSKMTEGYISISTAKAHFSIHFSEERYIEALRTKLPKCKAGKQCINIKYGDEETYQVVKDEVASCPILKREDF